MRTKAGPAGTCTHSSECVLACTSKPLRFAKYALTFHKRGLPCLLHTTRERLDLAPDATFRYGYACRAAQGSMVTSHLPQRTCTTHGDRPAAAAAAVTCQTGKMTAACTPRHAQHHHHPQNHLWQLQQVPLGRQQGQQARTALLYQQLRHSLGWAEGAQTMPPQQPTQA